MSGQRLALALLALGAAAAAPESALDRPQYIALNKGFPGGWLITDPSTFTQASFDEMLAAVNGTRGTAARKLAVSFDFWVLFADDMPTALASLDALLALALANDVAVSVSLDATQWWQARPDLWNWWNASAPGFDPANAANVEWSGPSPANATRTSWRDWGSQFRMATPAINYGAPAFRAAAAEAMAPLAARLAAWYRALPADKRWLLAYVRATQEVAIGTNFYYYRGGNDLPPGAPDPTGGPAAAAQTGFAAVCGGGGGGATASGACDGTAPLSSADLDAAVASFAAFAAGVLADAGLPRSRIMVHTGGDFAAPPPPAPAFNTAAAALVGGAFPGFSLYGAGADPARNPGLLAALGAIDGAPWGAPEWNIFAGPRSAWDAALGATLATANNRLLVVQNFESVRGDGAALGALAAALAAPPACLIDAPLALAATRVNATAFALAWAPPRGAAPDSLTVIASSLRETLPSGALAVADVGRAVVGGAATGALLSLPAGFDGRQVWWTVVARGCGGSQAVAADAAGLAVAARAPRR